MEPPFAGRDQLPRRVAAIGIQMDDVLGLQAVVGAAGGRDQQTIPPAQTGIARFAERQPAGVHGAAMVDQRLPRGAFMILHTTLAMFTDGSQE
jgi:hypothetical protein